MLHKNIYLSKSFLESIHLQCYSMDNKIQAKNIRIKITMVTFRSYNKNVYTHNNRMLSLWANSYSKFVIKILKKSLRHSLSIFIVHLRVSFCSTDE